jgi:hypothetical protein
MDTGFAGQACCACALAANAAIKAHKMTLIIAPPPISIF